MDTLFTLLPFVFNSRGSNRTTGDQEEYASSYGRFKPVYYVYPWPPRNDAEAQRFYNHIRTVAWYLDAIPYLSQAGLPFRIGVDDIISAIPFYGDFVGVVLSIYMVLLCWVFGAPPPILTKMATNVVIDGVIGILPVLGDVLDTLFKSNLRNLALLEEWLLKEGNKYDIQITPSDEFLPRKRTAKAKSGVSGLFGLGGGNHSSTTGRDKYKTGTNGSTSRAKGTYRFNRNDLDTSDLELD